jgi:hypothetical protein
VLFSTTRATTLGSARTDAVMDLMISRKAEYCVWNGFIQFVIKWSPQKKATNTL